MTDAAHSMGWIIEFADGSLALSFSGPVGLRCLGVFGSPLNLFQACFES